MKGNERWQKVIIGIVLASIMLVSVFAAMVPTGSARPAAKQIVSGDTIYIGEQGLAFDVDGDGDYGEAGTPDVGTLEGVERTATEGAPPLTLSATYTVPNVTIGKYYYDANANGDLDAGEFYLYVKKPKIRGEIILNTAAQDSIVGYSVPPSAEIVFKVEPNIRTDIPGACVDIELRDPDGVELTSIDGQALRDVAILGTRMFVGNPAPTLTAPPYDDAIDLTDLDTGTYKVKFKLDKATCNMLDVSSPEYTFTVCREEVMIEAVDDVVSKGEDIVLTIGGNPKTFYYVTVTGVDETEPPEIKAVGDVKALSGQTVISSAAPNLAAWIETGDDGIAEVKIATTGADDRTYTINVYEVPISTGIAGFLHPANVGVAEATFVSDKGVSGVATDDDDVDVVVLPPEVTFEEYVPGELLVWFCDNASESEINELIARLGTEVKLSTAQLNFTYMKLYSLRIVSNRTVWETVYLFEDEPIVKFAEPNYLIPLARHQLYPNDPGFPSQWNLLNAGHTGGTIDADIDMPQAWSLIDQYDLWRNDEPVIAVIDTGADLTHPDLVANLWTNPAEDPVMGGVAGVDDDGNGFVDDVHGFDFSDAFSVPFILFPPLVDPNGDGPQDFDGHGTHVAGIIGAVGDNGLDVAGVNWHAQIMVLRAIDPVRQLPPPWGRVLRSDSEHFSMIYAMLMKQRGVNVRVISASYGWPTYDPIEENLIAIAGRLDILFAAAAGNEATNLDIGEYIYRDNDGSRTITAGDMRLTDVTAFEPGPADPPRKDATRTYLAGPPAVVAADWDARAGTPLIEFLDRERYHDLNGDGNYDSPEPIYEDRDSNGIVSRGDFRWMPVAGMPRGSRVRVRLFGLPSDPDVGNPLTNFAVTEPFVDTNGNGRYDQDERFKDLNGNGAWDPGELHVDNRHIGAWVPGDQHGLGIGMYNGRDLTFYPATYPLDNIVAVAASNYMDHVADFSNYGKTSIDLAAPGDNITSLRLGGGVVTESGTSMSAPHVSGVASLAFAMFPEKTALDVKQDILFGEYGTPWPCLNVSRVPPASSVDRRPPFGAPPNSHRILVSDGRLRFPYTGDLGDAPKTYNTVASWVDGALHWDDGNEWFGFEDGATNEVEAIYPPPYDQDPTANLPCLTIPDMDLMDHPNPPNFWFWPPPPWAPGQWVQVEYYISTNYLGVNDAEGGRYQPVPNRMIYVNGFFDWDRNLMFAPWEHSYSNAINLAAMSPPGAAPAVSPPTTTTILIIDFFQVPPALPAPVTPLWTRFRLDYGEDVGLVNPDPPIGGPGSGFPGFSPDRNAPVSLWMNRSRFGEVEDFPNITIQYPMYLHAEPPYLIDLEYPMDTQWHELHPNFSRRYLLSSWKDTGEPFGVLSPCDQIDLTDKETGKVSWYHVEDITVTLKMTKKPYYNESMYIEYEGGWAGYNTVIYDPICTQWHEVYPAKCKTYHLSSWNDTNNNHIFDYCDQIDLTPKPEGPTEWWHVDEMSTDIILSPKTTITIEADTTCMVELKTLKLTVTGVAGDKIKVKSSPSENVIFKEGMDDTPTGADFHGNWFTDAIDVDGIRKYAVDFNDTGTYTIKVTVTDSAEPTRVGDFDTVDITVLEKVVTFDLPSTVVICEKLDIKGTATSGTYVSVYVDDVLYHQLTNIVIEDGEFSKEVTTTEVGMNVPGSVRLKAWIDCEKAAGEYPPARCPDGETAILLTTPELTAELSVPVVAHDDDFTVEGFATGQTEVVILSVPPKGGGGKSLLDRGEKGLSPRKVSVSTTDDTFSKKMTVQDEATAGYYDIYVLCTGCSGMDGGWGMTGESDLEAALDERYGIPSLTTGIITTKTQKEIGDILDDLIYGAGSDDLMVKDRLKVETAYVWLDPIASVGVGEPLVVTGRSNRQEGYPIVVTCTGPVELAPKTVEIENGTFSATFDTTDAPVGTYTVKADDGDGHTDTRDVKILVTVTVNAPGTAKSGETFVASIDVVDSIADFNTGLFDLSFDPSVVNVTDVANGSLNGETIPVDKWERIDEDTIRVFLAVSGIAGVNGSGNLATISFAVVGMGGDRSVLDISDGLLGNTEADEIPAVWVDDEVIVGPVTVVVNAPEFVAVEGTFTATIDVVDDVANFNMALFDLSFDSSVVNVTDAAEGSLDGTAIPVTSWAFIDSNTIRVMSELSGDTGVSGSGNLATISFAVVGKGGDRSILGISDGMLANNEAKEIPAEWIDTEAWVFG